MLHIYIMLVIRMHIQKYTINTAHYNYCNWKLTLLKLVGAVIMSLNGTCTISVVIVLLCTF